jgi:VWFA-related protein
MRSRRLGIACCALLAALPAIIQGQTGAPQRAPSFGAGIEVTRLNVSVTDGASRYVTGLSKADFSVFEDGIRQDLAFFESDPLPISLSMLIDCSASMEEKLPIAQAAGVRFVRTLGSRDLAQVAQFNDRFTILQDFTSDLDSLTFAVKGTHASGPTVLYNALYVAMKSLGSHGTASAPRRRAIVLLSDGEDTASLVNDEQVLGLARRGEVVVYPIGLQMDRPQDRARLEFSQATHFLTAVARETGGRAYFTSQLSELATVYDRIAEELRTQYTLGYVSDNPHRDGKWRRIVVRTPRREELQVRHKIGYYGPRG